MKGIVLWGSVAVISILVSCETSAAEWYMSGDLSGTWVSGDIIYIEGDVKVPDGNTLLIEPGVQVLFEGPYTFEVEGLLEARGTKAERIAFTRAYPTEQSKWRGLRFNGADPGSCLEQCLIEYVKREGGYLDARGGGIWIDQCSPEIRSCRIMNNESRNSSSNGAGGGICVDQGSFSVIEDNFISNNEADSGGGIFVGPESKPEIISNEIRDNTANYAGGGIYVSANAEAIITSNVIVGNHSEGWGGGGINLWSSTWLYGTSSTVCCNMICKNTATHAGGGIYSRYETSQLYNNTVAQNQAANGGGFYVLTFSDCRPELCNSIVWDNMAYNGPQIFLDPEADSAIDVTYCNVMDTWPGTGNMNAEPLFVHPASDDFHLYYDSPCLDAGDAGLAGLPAIDFEGDPRIRLDSVDMGADEFCKRLYVTGDFTPGGYIRGRFVGVPGTNPTGLIIGSSIYDPPMPVKWGDLYVGPPWEVVAPLGSIPANGVKTLHATLPILPAAPYSIPLQAIIGEDLTPLFEMDIF